MSLEQRIDALNNSIQNLIAVLSKAPMAQVEETTPAVNDVAPVETKPESKQQDAAQPEVKDETTVEVTYDDLKAEFLKLASKNQEAAVKILGEFNIKKMPELAKDQYPAMLAALQAKNAG